MRVRRDLVSLFGVVICAMLVMGADSRRALDLSVDGRSAGSIAALAVDGHLMVAVEGLAPNLGVAIRRTDKGIFLGADPGSLILTEGDLVVRQGDAELWRLQSLPRAQNGQLFVDINDLPRLFNLEVKTAGDSLALVSKRATRASTGRFDLRAYSAARMRSLNVNFSNDKLATNLMVSGAGAGTYIAGYARITSRDRQVTLGRVDDPLRGTVFAGQQANGVAVRLPNGTTVSTALRARDLRRSFALSQHSGDSERNFVVSGRQGGFDQVLVGLRKTSDSSSGSFESEAWIGNRGLAAGIDYRTNGRFFTEFRAGFAGAGLPLGPGDAPLRINVGYDLTQVLTLRTGFANARGIYPSSYIEIDAKRHNAELDISRSLGYTNLSLALDGPESNANFSLYTGRGDTSIAGQGVVTLGRGLLKFDSSFDRDWHDTVLEFQPRRSGFSPVLGFESIASDGASRLRPTLGLAYPMGKGLEFSVELRPTMSGSALRLSVTRPLPASR